jgi:MATE family, multidrug efflux pump
VLKGKTSATPARARALGAGRREHANALVVHALVIAVVMAAVFTLGMLVCGPAIYAALGGRDAALTYSTVVFAGAITPWLFNTLASIVRGTIWRPTCDTSSRPCSIARTY